MKPLLVDIGRPGDHAATVVAIPPAGAGMAYFAPWTELLSPPFRIAALRLPGREDLWEEEPLRDGEEILLRLVTEIAAAPDENLIIFGSCTGGLLAYELTSRLLHEQLAEPRALVLSGTPTPAASREALLSQSPTGELRDYYTQVASEPLPDEVWEFAEPRVRADLQAVERCDFDGRPLPVPIVIVRGSGDAVVSQNEARRWAAHAGAGLVIRGVAGGHFLMSDRADELSQEMLAVLRRYGRPSAEPNRVDPAVPSGEPAVPSGEPAVPSGEPAVPSGEPAVSAKEQALWLLQKFAPELGVVNVTAAFRLGGRIRWWPLQAALARLIGRHAALRTLFPEKDGALVRAILDQDDKRAAATLETIAVTPDTLAEVLGRLAAQPFDAQTDLPLWAAHLIGAGSDVVILVAQHLTVDRVSMNVMLRELVEMYAYFSRSQELPAKFACEVPRYVEPAATDEDRQYWRTRLSGKLDVGSRPLAIGRDCERLTFAGGEVIHRLSPSAQAALASLASTQSATRNIVLLAAYALLLAWHGSESGDIVIGLPIDARDRSHRNSVGYHVNVIALSLDVASAGSFADAVRRTRDAFLIGISHSRASIDEIFPGSYESTGAGTDRQPLFRHMYNYVVPDVTGWTDQLGVELVDVERPASRLDLELTVADQDAQTLLRCVYSADVFGRAEVESLLARFDELIRQAAASPDVVLDPLSMWTPADRALADAAVVPPELAGRESGAGLRVAILSDAGRELPPRALGQLCLVSARAGERQPAGRVGGDWRYRPTGWLARIRLDRTLELVGERAPDTFPADADAAGSVPARSVSAVSLAPGPARGGSAAAGSVTRGSDPAGAAPADARLADFFVAQWRELLGLPGLARDAHFFRHGGTSLKAARLVTVVKQQFGVKLSLRDVFRAPTPARLAHVLAERLGP